MSFAITLPPPLSAQAPPIEELIVTSSRIPQPLWRIGTSVSVLSGTEIDAHGNLILTDVLRQLPGIAVSGNGGAGKATTLRIRGEEGFRTLTIMDGIRLSDPSGPQIMPLLEHQLSGGLGRVEVLRGPQGLGYGADAGGVLAISSRQNGGGMNAMLDAQTGRYGTRQYSANLGGGNERVDFSLSALDFQTEGFNTFVPDQTLADNDGYANTTLHGRLGVALSEAWRMELVRRQVKGDNQLDNCFLTDVTHNCADTYDLQASRAALQYESAAFSHAFSYASTDTGRENFAEGISVFTTAGELERWEYLGSARALPGFDLVFGADLERSDFNEGGRDNLGYYLEYLSDFSDSLSLSAGARYDDNDDFGANTSYRLSGAYLFTLGGGTVKLKGSYGTGFRAPSPYEIAYNAGAFAYPPASLVNLAQEKSRGAEAGLEYFTADGLHLEAVYFDQKVEDAIYFDLSSFSGYLQDAGLSRSRGIELSGQFHLSETVDVSVNYTYND
ncbi:MAG: TonB-dependent receptor, partial [Pseudomonadales bacterium]|nr:TonB-dependent receptor [Pseudomonadales bacterium]